MSAEKKKTDWLLKTTRPKLIPKFARKSAMGISAVFR